MPDSHQTLLPGFEDPVLDAQSSFRCVLDALSEPGRILTLGPAPEAPTGCSVAATAVLLTLADLDAPVWLQEPDEPTAGHVRFHTGAPVLDRPEEALFGLVHDLAKLPDLEAFNLGSEEFPDRSITLILEGTFLSDGQGLSLKGPGIPQTRSLAFGMRGLEPSFWTRRAQLEPLFPRGLDLILTCGNTLAALPRTTIVKE